MPSPESLHAAEADDVARERGSLDVGTSTTTHTSAQPTPAARRNLALWTALPFAFVALLLLVRLSAFGVWDPWELRVADDARRLATQGAEHTDLGRWLVSWGFRWLGVHEWTGRLPIALSALLCVWSAYRLVARSDPRAGVYAALIAGSTPLLLFNGRTMLGAAPDMALSGLLGSVALAALAPTPADERESGLRRALLIVLALALAAAAIATRGALLAVVPPLGAALVFAGLNGARDWPNARRVAGLVLGASWLLCLALIARDVQRDATDFSVWLGGASAGDVPPTFDSVVEQVFHAFAPWSALLPLALSYIWSGAGELRTRALQSACWVWVALAYGTQTLFVSRYGHASFLALPPLAAIVALSLRDLERDGVRSWAAGIGVLLLCGLVLRDFALFPGSPLHALALDKFEPPKNWNPRSSWSAALIPFAVCAALGLATPEANKLDLGAPYRFVGVQWRRGLGFKLWLLALSLLILAAFAFGLLAYAIPTRLHLPSLALKVVRKLIFMPVALSGVVLAFQLLSYGFGLLRANRFVPLLIAGAALGAYAAQIFLPSFSRHFSSRELYTLYNSLSGPGESIAEYRVSSRAAAYYAKGPVVEVATASQLLDHLSHAGQRWATFPEAELAELDHQFRARTGRHLIVMDAQAGRAVLVATQPVSGHDDQNPLRDVILKNVPSALQHPVSVDFDDRVQLVGYDVELPHGSYVGAGESFTLTWYFRSVHKLTSAQRVFVHIDGQGQRIHGDHDPNDGKYPANLWEPGDIVADRQKIEVPASYRPGEYVIYMGFFSGDTRLPIKQGPNAGEDRARVGVLRIQ